MGYWSTTEGNDLSDTLFEIAKSHADATREGLKHRQREVDYLKAQIALLEHQIATLRAENQSLCNQIRRLGARPLGGYLNMRGKR